MSCFGFPDPIFFFFRLPVGKVTAPASSHLFLAVLLPPFFVMMRNTTSPFLVFLAL